MAADRIRGVVEMVVTALLCAALAGTLILVCWIRLQAQLRRHKNQK